MACLVMQTVLLLGLGLYSWTCVCIAISSHGVQAGIESHRCFCWWSRHVFAVTSRHLLMVTSRHLLMVTSRHFLMVTTRHLVVVISRHLVMVTSRRLLMVTTRHLVVVISRHVVVVTSRHLVVVTSRALSPIAASAGVRSCSAVINLYIIPGRMSLAYTVIPMTGTEMMAPTTWLADAQDTIKVHLMCVWYCHPRMHGVYGPQVLRFYCVWDDRQALYGDRRPYRLHYFLEDDTVEILELHENNDGRDPFPVFLRRGPLPKVLPLFLHA